MTGSHFNAMWRDRRGATAIEYGVLAGGLGLSIAAAVFVLGGNVAGLFGGVGGFVSGERDTGDGGGMRVIARQTFETDREGWSGMAQLRTLDKIGTGLSLASESRIGDAAEAVSRTFDIPEGATRAEISFDLSFVDSWDDEQARIYLDGAQVAAGRFAWGRDDPPSLTLADDPGVTVSFTPTNSVQAGTWSNGSRGTDHSYAVTITVDDPGETLRLGFGTSLDQAQSDESLLIGNVELRADR